MGRGLRDKVGPVGQAGAFCPAQPLLFPRCPQKDTREASASRPSQAKPPGPPVWGRQLCLSSAAHLVAASSLARHLMPQKDPEVRMWPWLLWAIVSHLSETGPPLPGPTQLWPLQSPGEVHWMDNDRRSMADSGRAGATARGVPETLLSDVGAAVSITEVPPGAAWGSAHPWGFHPHKTQNTQHRVYAQQSV